MINTNRHFGGYLFIAAVAGIATVQVVTQHLHPGLFPVAPMIAENKILVNVLAAYLLIACAMSFTKKYRGTGSILIGSMFLISFLAIHLPVLLPDLHNGGEWTVAFEALAISAGAFIKWRIHNLVSVFDHTKLRAGSPDRITGMAAYYCFAISLIVFGSLHVVYLDYIVTLIPGWLPLKTAFAYIVLLAFFISAASLILRRVVRPAMLLLALMFAVWVLILHGPRVFVGYAIEAEWVSLFVALAMSGIALMIAENAAALFRSEEEKVESISNLQPITEL
jgi:hypothetical protein